MPSYPYDGPNPSEPLDEFTDGELRFRFFVLPVHVSINLVRGAEADGRLSVRLFGEAFEAATGRLSLRRDTRWKIVLLRSRSDAWLTHTQIVMAEFVASEEDGLKRVDELIANWRRGQEFVNLGSITFAELRQAVRRSKPNLGPVSIPQSAVPAAPRGADSTAHIKTTNAMRTGEVSLRARTWIITVLVMICALVASEPGGARVFVPFTLACGLVVYLVFTWLYRSKSG